MIDIINLTKIPVDKTFFTGVAKKVLTGENKRTTNVSIAFVTPAEIQKLNKKYRKKDKPTDVLSFGKVSDFKDEHVEVIICPAVVKEKTQDSPLSLKKEMVKTLVHGLLHTLGYDHERSSAEHRRMEEKEKYYFSKL